MFNRRLTNNSDEDEYAQDHGHDAHDDGARVILEKSRVEVGFKRGVGEVVESGVKVVEPSEILRRRVLQRIPTDLVGRRHSLAVPESNFIIKKISVQIIIRGFSFRWVYLGTIFSREFSSGQQGAL